jgi:hypothetical protein
MAVYVLFKAYPMIPLSADPVLPDGTFKKEILTTFIKCLFKYLNFFLANLALKFQKILIGP